MIYFRSILILVFYIMFDIALSMQMVQKNANGAIGFPEIEERPMMVNKQNRQPVFIPSICPENQLLYPGDQKDDWICDCRPAHIYHPKSDKCWPAYQRGPCQINEYLVLNNKSSIPTCVPNPCKVNGMVVWNGKCEMVGKPCGENFPVAVLWVDAATINIDCVVLIEGSGFSMNQVYKKTCPVGSKRNIQNKCVAS